MEKLIRIIIALSLILITSGAVTYAQNSLIIPKPETLPGPSEKTQEAEAGGAYGATVVLPTITKAIIGFAAITSFIFLIISGIRFMLAYGSTEAVASAKKQAQWAIIGLVITLFAYAIVSIITSISFK